MFDNCGRSRVPYAMLTHMNFPNENKSSPVFNEACVYQQKTLSNFQETLKVMSAHREASGDPLDPALHDALFVFQGRNVCYLVIDCFLQKIQILESPSPEIMLHSWKEPEVTGCKIRRVGRVRDELDLFLAQKVLCHLRGMHGGIGKMQKKSSSDMP